MIKIPDDDIALSTATLIESYEKASKSNFTEDKFLMKVLPRLSKETKRVYPYQVKIPKSLQEMIDGDFEPARIITINSPFEGPYGEMWFGDASSGFRLLAGYQNGDSRFVCDKSLGDADVHGILVGATGQGKSVTLNAFIYGGCYMYPPWELCLTLCDAKVVEFKSIAVNNPMPQISAVAATGDADYLISVLADKSAEMTRTNSMFTAAGKAFGKDIKKIEEFREITQLALPQNIIIIDEFQTMFKNAGKKIDALMSSIYNFAKLGRSTGYHLLLASQEIGSDLNKDIIANIKLRMAMGCFADVSEAVLGNDGAAANMGKKGYMILNSDPAVKQNKTLNKLFRVPFAPPDQIGVMSSAIIDAGKQVDFRYTLKFYDEQKSITEKDYPRFLKQFKLNRNALYLGEPAFVLNKKEQCLKIDFSNESVENVCVLANSDSAVSRYVKMIKCNLELIDGTQSVVLCTHSTIAEDSKIKSLAGNLYYEDKQYEDSMFFGIAKSTVYRRRMILEADKCIFSGLKVRNKETDALFEQSFPSGSKEDTSLNRERFAHYIRLTAGDAQLMAGFGIDPANASRQVDKRVNIAKTAITSCCNYGLQSVQATNQNLPVMYFWIIGVDRVIGLGRSSKQKFIDDLLRIMQDSCEANCRFIMCTTTLQDLNSLSGGIKWFIVEGVASGEINKAKLQDYYPNEVGNGLGVLCNVEEKTSLKFKKMLHTGEITV